MTPVGLADASVLSFEQFFAHAWAGAFRLACLLTQDRGAAEDIAQDAFAQMYKTWGRAERPDAYLRTTVVNRCRNWRRHARVREEKLPLIATAVSVDFRADELADVVASLPFRQRAVIVLRYYGGLSEAEIGAALGCRTGTVKSLSSRALARLERVIER
ncbi:MAG: SigE family RNA polymerase sigma factor [Acidimicrobiales bacterium]